jgi:hypothetical protein
VLSLQSVDGAVEVVFEGIGDSHEFCGAGGVHGLVCGTATTTAAADQTDADGFVTADVSCGGRGSGRQSAKRLRLSPLSPSGNLFVMHHWPVTSCGRPFGGIWNEWVKCRRMAAKSVEFYESRPGNANQSGACSGDC